METNYYMLTMDGMSPMYIESSIILSQIVNLIDENPQFFKLTRKETGMEVFINKAKITKIEEVTTKRIGDSNTKIKERVYSL